MHLFSFWDILRLLSCLLPETEELPSRTECFNSGEFSVKQHPIVLVQGPCAHLFSSCRAAVRLCICSDGRSRLLVQKVPVSF